MADIGFIGLGNMGAPMAANLLKAGHRVSAWDIVPAAVAAVAQQGARAAASAAEAVAAGEIVITMLPAGPQVREVYLGNGGVLGRAAKGALLIDCSTIDVETARAVAAAAGEAGFDMLDAPVSGGTAGAAGASLTFMVGGSAAAFARAQPILAAMGRTIVHTGPAGSGQAVKICNNMMLAVSMIGTCEALSSRAKARPRAADPVRCRQQIHRPVLGVDRLLPGAGAGAVLAGQPRLCAGVHRGDDAEGSAAGAAGGRSERRRRPRLAPSLRRSISCSSTEGTGALDFSAIYRFIAKA